MDFPALNENKTYKHSKINIPYMKKYAFLLALSLAAATTDAQTIFSEDFEAVTVNDEVGPLPDGWTMYADNLTNNSSFAKFGSGWVVSQVETANQAAASVSYVTSSSDCDRWLITPSIAVPSGSYTLKFRAFVDQTSTPEKLRVAVSTTDAQKSSFTTTLRDIVFNGTEGTTAGWNNIELPLSDFAGQQIIIAFVNHGNSHFIFVDDVRINTSTDNFHMVLMETFTSQYCSQCPQGHTYEEGAYEGLENRVAWVSHHAGFQNDDYTIPASTQLETLYGGSTYAPAIMFDRDRMYSTSSDPGPVHYVGDSYSMHQQLSRATSVADNIVLGFTNISYNPSSRTLQATVDGYFIADHSIDNPRLTVYLVEDSLIGAQSYGTGSHSNYRHDHVLRACLTDSWGDNVFIATSASSSFTKTVSYTLPANMRPDKCYLVAFVCNHGSAITDRKVHNTTKSGYITTDQGQALQADDIRLHSCQLSLRPNPASEVVYVSAQSPIRHYTVTDMTGRTVMQGSTHADMLELHVSHLRAGIYIVRVTTANGSATARMVVK